MVTEAEMVLAYGSQFLLIYVAHIIKLVILFDLDR